MTGVLPYDWRPWHYNQWAFVSPSHAKKQDKTVVDCSAPWAHLNRDYWSRNLGSAPGLWVPTTLVGYFQMAEEVPYAQGHSTWDQCFLIWGMMHASWMNMWFGRKSAGQVNPWHPRTVWAHRVVFTATILRINMAWLVGCCGFFYLYEYLYTNAPYFKIDDPSPEGWKCGWRPGQSTYAARTLAALVTTYPAWYLYKGEHKRGMFATGCHVMMQGWYEFCRIYCAPQSDNGLYYQSSEIARKWERYGSLTPECYRQPERDGNRPEWTYSYENLRFAHSSLAKQAEQNKNHEYQPLGFFSPNIPNPYFDFQKAAKVDREASYRWKSDTFELPLVMTSTMQSGALDQTMS